MRKPTFTKATHPFNGDFITWCDDCVHLGLGELFVDQAMSIAVLNAKKEGTACTVTREQLRFWGYDIYSKQGWEHDTLIRMGFKPIVGDWRDSAAWQGCVF
ncbi:hypothetical protein [Thiocapsa rosea]|uniref:Uncharacterized protein n=1 Tax=Thiocapsa rosea TaxID=69360 RepID=A0A495V7J0_9GAMM|nr:hypothetical protein [Thiocapsa rosea]RKT44680.1 hypothetical protein BDD21_2075 [Thiocapsa rosea]